MLRFGRRVVVPKGLCGLCQVGVAMKHLCGHGQQLLETWPGVRKKVGLEQLTDSPFTWLVLKL